MAPSRVVDFDAVRSFRGALIREEVAKARLTEIFVTTARHEFTRSADAVLDRLRLSDEVRSLYKQCRPYTPILIVSPDLRDGRLFRTHVSSASNNFNGCRGTAKHWKIRTRRLDGR